MSQHALYVASAYGVAIIGLGALLITLLIGGRTKKRQLDKLEAIRAAERSQTKA